MSVAAAGGSDGGGGGGDKTWKEKWKIPESLPPITEVEREDDEEVESSSVANLESLKDALPDTEDLNLRVIQKAVYSRKHREGEKMEIRTRIKKHKTEASTVVPAPPPPTMYDDVDDYKGRRSKKRKRRD